MAANRVCPPPSPSHVNTPLMSAPSGAAISQDQALPEFMANVLRRLDNLEEAHVTIARLQAALEESESARRDLEEQVRLLTATAPTVPTVPTVATPTATIAPLATKTFASVVASSAPVKKLRKKKKRSVPAAIPADSPPVPSAKAMRRCARAFRPLSALQSGYRFVYFQIGRKQSVQRYRSFFRSLGLDNSRVLDLHFPVRDVVSVLLHTDFVLEFTSAMASLAVASPLLGFDPYDVRKFLSPAALVQKAKELQNLRVLRAITFVRPSVRVSVARSMLEQDYIEQAQFDAILAEELEARASQTASRRSSVPSERVLKSRRRLPLRRKAFCNFRILHKNSKFQNKRHTPLSFQF
ncbi:hypothetical protein G6F56_011265 [Rhizopus delemar]|nr:hypothetical protein G6F56_011265 [Rhizopus delemar]